MSAKDDFNCLSDSFCKRVNHQPRRLFGKVNPNPLPPQRLGGMASCRATAKRVKHQFALFGGRFKNALQKCKRFLSRIARHLFYETLDRRYVMPPIRNNLASLIVLFGVFDSRFPSFPSSLLPLL